MIPKHGRRDQNEPAIIAALRSVGASVVSLSIPDGPDLLVGLRGKTYCFEIKTETGKLRKGQKVFSQTWEGHYAVVRSVDEALAEIGLIGAESN